MFTIDLLKGAGKPPQSRPLSAAGATLAFMVLVVATTFDGLRYYRDGSILAAQKHTLSYYQGEIFKLQDVAKTLDQVEKRRTEINAALAEVDKALGNHATWSPIIAALAQSASTDLVVTDMMAKREEQGVGDKARFVYTLMLGVMSPSGAVVVEQFVRTLRLALPLQPGPDSIRIISQRQEMAAGKTIQYYVIECRLKM
jgi:hypothetical protein